MAPLFVYAPSAHAFSGGAGTVGNPYQISTATELASMTSYIGSGYSSTYFILTADIDLNVSPYNTGSGWTPIGNSTTSFYGKFDGGGHTISGLYINRSGTSKVGLFGSVVSSGIVKNVTLSNANVTGYEQTGGLVGYYTSSSTIENVYVSGAITGGGSNGGTGGVVGWCHIGGGTVTHSSSSASISSTNRSGGLVGYSYCAITNSSSTGNVVCTTVSSTWCGGLTGVNSSGVTNSYATGSVTGPASTAYIGGLIGGNFSTVSYSYSKGAVVASSGSSIGGLIGTGASNVTNSFWDTETSGRASSAAGTGKTTSQMNDVATFTNTSTSTGLATAWDFVSNPNNDASNNDYWNISTGNGGYPFLVWQDFAPPNANPDTPINLGPAGSVSGDWATDETPTFEFEINDDDVADEVGYQIQVDDTADFSSPVINYVSGTKSQGSFNFVVGQVEGDGTSGVGTYAVGSEGQELSDGEYYWRVKSLDQNDAESSYSTANSALVAFGVDTTAPTVPGAPSVSTPTNDTTPSISWAGSTDDGAGLYSLPYGILLSQDEDFSDWSLGSSATTSYTPSALAEGTWYVKVRAQDDISNISAYSSPTTFVVDTTAPTLSGLSPTDNATGVAIDSDLILSFSSSVTAGTGNVVIHKDSDDSVVETIPIDDSRVSGSGTNTITINPTTTLVADTGYYIQIASTALEDSAGNTYAGIANTTSWSFTTLEAPVVTCEHPDSTTSSITGTCEVTPSGWGTTTWEARYKKASDVSYTTLTLDDDNIAEATVSELEESTEYYLEFRYTNDYGTSNWSRIEITTTENVDDDNDGINDTIEDAAPNGGDANNDGTPDSDQANVSSILNPLTNKYVVLELANDNCFITAIDILQEGWDGNQDEEFDYENGMMDFTASCNAPGLTTTVTQYYYGVDGIDFSPRKYNTTTGEFLPISGSTILPNTISGGSVAVLTYSVTDGGILDEDRLTNSAIEDPAGLGSEVTNTKDDSLSNTGQSAVFYSAIAALLMLGGLLVAKRTKIIL